MTELTVEQIDRLAASIVKHMLEDPNFMYDVACDQAREWSLREYLEWLAREAE